MRCRRSFKRSYLPGFGCIPEAEKHVHRIAQQSGTSKLLSKRKAHSVCASAPIAPGASGIVPVLRYDWVACAGSYLSLLRDRTRLLRGTQ